MKNISEIISMENYNAEDEWIILSYAILLDEVASYVYEKYKANQIKAKHFSPYMQTIFAWVMNYYKKFEKAPGQTIQEIFNDKKDTLRADKMKIIKGYLDRLSDEFDQFEETGINPDYIRDVTIPKFVKRQETELLIEDLQKKLSENKLDEVEAAIDSFTPLTDDEYFDPEMGTSTPGSMREIRKYFGEEKDKSALFRLPGSLGLFLGPFYKGSLTAVTGIEKAGKTYMLQEIGIQAVMYYKLKVLGINLEMPINDMNERFWQRLGGFSVDDDNAGIKVLPIFDCENNQYGTCEVLKKKKNKKDLLSYEDDLVSYYERRDWRICTKCRELWQRVNVKKTKKFVPAIWYREKEIRKLTEQRIDKVMKKYLPYGISNYRIKCFPTASVTYEDVREYINQYVKTKRWKPDVIIIDYPDIMMPVEGKINDRMNVDFAWKSCKRLATEMDAAVFVADQAVKAARSRRSLTNMDTSESKTKDAHLDLRMTINVTDTEEILGLARIGILFKRKGKKSNAEIMVLRRLETGHTLLDSERWPFYGTHYPTVIKKD